MRTIWERFENALGNAIINTSATSVSTRSYIVDVGGTDTAIDAEYPGADILRITCPPVQPPADNIDLLKASWTTLFWKFSIRSDAALLQTELFADDFGAAPGILGALKSPIGTNAGIDRLFGNEPREETQKGEDNRLQRLRATLQSDLPVTVKEDEGAFLFVLQPAGIERPYHLRCAPIGTHVLRVTAPFEQKPVDEPAVARYLVRRNRDLVGCKTGLDPTGAPFLISDIPLSSIEHEGAARRLTLFAECLRELRPILGLHDPGVRNLYHHITNHQQGDIQHGYIA